jgi:hypothetical protein
MLIHLVRKDSQINFLNRDQILKEYEAIHTKTHH